MVPIDLAEHHVAGKDHHLGGGSALVGDRQAVARLVQAQAADQPLLVEIAAVGHAGVQAVADQVVHLVDVDRPAEHALQDSLPRAARLAGKQRGDVPRLQVPIVAQRVGQLPFQQKAVGEQLVRGHAGQSDVLDGVAERPVAQVVQQGGDEEGFGVGLG